MDSAMPGNTTLTLRIDSELKDQLDQLAQSTHRSKSYLAAEAIRQFVAVNNWQIDGINKAVKMADGGGPFIPHDEVEAWLTTWGTDDEIPPPNPKF